LKRLSPREQRRILERMGLNLRDLPDVEEVTLKLKDKVIVIRNPVVHVLEIKGGGKIYQVSGNEEVAAQVPQTPVEVSDEDVDLVVAQTGVSRDEARQALLESGGDLAKAILLLSAKKRGV